MEPITVLKKNIAGVVTWQYNGEIIRRFANGVNLQAPFNLDDTPFMDTHLKRNDRFVEWFYTDRWYNIFEIHDRDDDRIKGWYCNLGHPAVWADAQTIAYVDLALDLWVSVDGSQKVLDEDEFEELDLDHETRAQCLKAMSELLKLFEKRKLWVE